MHIALAHTHAHDDVGVVGNSADYVDVAGNSYTSYSSSSGSGQPAGYSYSNANGSSYYNNGKVVLNEQDYDERDKL